MTNRLIAALLAGCLMFGMLAGCSGRDDGSSEEEEVEAPSETETPASRAPAGPITDEAAASINGQIQDSDVNLVQFSGVDEDDTIATIYTTEGTIRIKLFPDQAPKAVENFIALAKDGYYNGITFGKVVAGLLIQAGDPGDGGQSSFATGSEPGYFEDEYSLDLWHFRGAVAMAHEGGQLDTNASQFYIVQRDYVTENTLEGMRSIQFPDKVIDKYEEVGGAPHLDWEFTVFGMVLDDGSMDVVDQINKARTTDDEPDDPILIENISIASA